MPVSEISGLAGTLPGNPDPGGLQAFAEHLAAARDRDKQSALKEMQFMMDLTNSSGGKFTPDPKVLAKVAKRAGLQGMVGPSGTNDMFTALADTAKTKAQRETETFQQEKELKSQQIEASKEGVLTSQEQRKREQAQTAQIIQQTGFDKVNQVLTEQVNKSKERLANPSAYEQTDEGRAQQKADAMSVAIHEKLSPEMMERLGMSPGELADFDKQVKQQRQVVLDTAKLNMVNSASGYTIIDPKTKKPRALTTDELQGMINGKMPQGIQTPQMTEMQFRSMTAGAEMMRAQAEMMDARARGKLTDAQVEKFQAESAKDLAQAEALRKKGITTSYDDILKGFEALDQMKKAGGKPDPALMQTLEKALGSYYGYTPTESKSFLTRAYEAIFGTGGKPAAALSEGQDTSLSGTAGRAVRNIPKDIHNFQTGIMAGEKDVIKGLENFASNVVSGKSIEGEKPLTDDEINRYLQQK